MSVLGCARGKRCCVTGDTRILTPGGMVRMDELAYRFFRMKAAEVVTVLADGSLANVAVRKLHTDKLAKEVRAVSFAGGAEIKLTDYHPVLLATREFRRAGSLVVGDEVAGVGEVVHVVRRVRVLGAPALVYDIECDGSVYIANGIAVQSYVEAAPPLPKNEPRMVKVEPRYH